ncbi:MAG: hypothetical protein RL180_16 [Pseudomonadota bacterium]|jgi:hypothetical protein
MQQDWFLSEGSVWWRFGLVLGWSICAHAHAALLPLDDQTLSQSTGQAVLNLTYIAPGESGNTNKIDGSTTNNVGFYKLGLQAVMNLNLNAANIQLGCGGDKGTGCDISLSNVSLTGATAVNGEYASSDAVITNPFMELAIKNPTSASTREFVGIRFGAESLLGLLSIGTNTDTSSLTDDTGISSLSGALTVNVTNAQLTNVGVGCATWFGSETCTIGPTTAVVASHTQNYTLNRASTLTLTGMSASAAGLTLGNVNMNNIPLTNIHKILLAADSAGTTASTDVYLSMQKTNLVWQTTSTGTFGTTAAQTGWWINLPNVQVADIVTDQSIRLTLLQAGAGLFGGAVNLDAVDLQQQPVDNCYGTLTFC